MSSRRLATIKPGPSVSRSIIRIVINGLLTPLPLFHHKTDTFVFSLSFTALWTLSSAVFKQHDLKYDVSVIISGLGESFKIITITSHRNLKKKFKQHLRSDVSE